jgi:membrane-associated phospholipid phosphatase
MSALIGIDERSNYLARLFAITRLSLFQLVRPPSQPRRTKAMRRLARDALLAAVIVSLAIVALMFGIDAREIGMMPPRGTASLWPFRILTDFGKDVYVLSLIGAMLVVVGLVAAALKGSAQARFLAFGLRLQFIFFAVAVPLVPGEAIKWIVGRARPFVGGEANPFNFAPFAGTEAYASLPSAHAVTAFALAFAVSAVWPRARGLMIAYALMIAFTRLVLLAHHPSDVLAGALIGVLGAMAVRYWFAARHLGFAIGRNGTISPLAQGRFKRVAHEPLAP